MFYWYRIEGFDSFWSVSHLSFVMCWHLFVISGYIIRWGFWFVFVLLGFCYNEVLSHTFSAVTLAGLWSIFRRTSLLSGNVKQVDIDWILRLLFRCAWEQRHFFSCIYSTLIVRELVLHVYWLICDKCRQLNNVTWLPSPPPRPQECTIINITCQRLSPYPNKQWNETQDRNRRR